MRPARIAVINLDRRTDRWQDFQGRFRSAFGSGAAVTRIPGVDQRDNPVAGCWQAHINALRSDGDGDGPILVLEDDALFLAGFTLDLPEPPVDWRLLRLGGILRTGNRAMPWAAVRSAAKTHAYIARDPLVLAERIESHRRKDVNLALQEGIVGHYRLNPAMVGQAPGRSDITGRRMAAQIWK